MSAHVPTAPGYLQMLKEGAKYFSGQEEAVFRSIQASKALAQCLRNCYGPLGRNKLVINRLGKTYVTSDAATILRELEIEHPVAKMLLLASEMQELEVGDGTNFVVLLAGALLENAGELLRMGLSVSEVMAGYEKASKKALEILEKLSCSSLNDIRDVHEVTSAVRTAIASKQYGYEDFLSKLIAESCVAVMSKAGSFNTDNVRVCKVTGADILSSTLLGGMVFKREAEGCVTSAKKAKVVLYSCTFELSNTDTKGTMLIKKAVDLMHFCKGEEALMQSRMQDIVQTGVTVIVVGGKIGDLALHYAEKYKLMVVKMTSRYDFLRLGRALGATPLLNFTVPIQEEIGYCDNVYMAELGDAQVVVFKQDKQCQVATIVLRGATEELLGSVEQAIKDGINAYSTLTQDNRLVPGAGATEIELALQIAAYGQACPGLEQYPIIEFSKALESIPRALADNAGAQVSKVIAKLYAAHEAGSKGMGVDIQNEDTDAIDAVEEKILDPLLLKHWGLKLATNAAVTVLSVDQIIIAKKSGGPKPRGENPNWDLEPDLID
ncbi:T-complex protein 1 subunit theta-like [Latimeria chalumnae]